MRRILTIGTPYVIIMVFDHNCKACLDKTYVSDIGWIPAFPFFQLRVLDVLKSYAKTNKCSDDDHSCYNYSSNLSSDYGHDANQCVTTMVTTLGVATMSIAIIVKVIGVAVVVLTATMDGYDYDHRHNNYHKLS